MGKELVPIARSINFSLRNRLLDALGTSLALSCADNSAGATIVGGLDLAIVDVLCDKQITVRDARIDFCDCTNRLWMGAWNRGGLAI